MSGYYLLRMDLRRAFTSPPIYISICISLVILLRPLVETIAGGGGGTFLTLQTLPFGLSDYTPFAAIFCVLPFADSFCVDYNSGMVTPIVQRVGIRRYALGRCLSVALSGGIAMGLTVLITLVSCFVLAEEPDTYESVRFWIEGNSLWHRIDLIFRYHSLGVLVYRVLFGFLFGCAWAMVGLAISTLVVNRYITFIAPFVIYQAGWFLIKGNCNPVKLLRGDYVPSVSYLVCCQLAVVGACSVFSYFRIRKKVIV